MAEFRHWREENRVPLHEVIPLDTPYNIQIETSSLCNAKCVYCAHSTKDHGLYEGNMTMELFEHILHDVKAFPHRVKVFEMFSFGEPLCNPLLPEMISLARKSGLCDKINFTTNGLLFTPEKTDKIIAAGVDTIRVSLQGLDSETYKRVCGINVNFKNFINNLRYLYEHSGTCKIRMKIADLALENADNGMEKLKSIFGDIADSIYVENIIPMFQGIDYDAINTQIKENSINGRENIKQSEMHKVCHRPFYRFRVAADGKVTAACCDKPNDIYFGDINKSSLVDLWNSEARKAFLKMQLRGEKSRHPVCKTCVLANDITSEADLLDPWAAELLVKF